MSYTIWYGESPAEKRRKKLRKYRKYVVAAVLLAVLTVGTARVPWQQLRQRLLPAEAVSAFSELTENLRNGQPFGEAVTAFCQEIVDGAKENPLGH